MMLKSKATWGRGAWIPHTSVFFVSDCYSLPLRMREEALHFFQALLWLWSRGGGSLPLENPEPWGTALLVLFHFLKKKGKKNN